MVVLDTNIVSAIMHQGPGGCTKCRAGRNNKLERPKNGMETTCCFQSLFRSRKQREAGVLTQLALRSPDEVLLTTPVAAEIRFGLARLEAGSRRQTLLAEAFHKLAGAVTWADWQAGADEIFGRQKARLQRLGTPVDDMDLVIGSIALSLGASVATRNSRHFERLEGLVVEVWD